MPAAQTVAEVQAALDAGDPQTLTDAAAAFKAVADALDKIDTDAGTETENLAGDDGPWQGDSATAFHTYMTDFCDRCGDASEAIGAYPPALSDAAQALTDAKTQFATLLTELEKARADADPGTTIDESSYDTQASAILETLAKAYRTCVDKLKPLNGDGKGDGTGDGDATGDGAGGDGAGGDGGDGTGAGGGEGDGTGDGTGDGDGTGTGTGAGTGTAPTGTNALSMDKLPTDKPDKYSLTTGPGTHATPVDLGNPNSPTVGHPVSHLVNSGGDGFGGKPTSSLIFDPTKGTPAPVPSIGRDAGGDPTTSLTAFTGGPLGPVPATGAVPLPSGAGALAVTPAAGTPSSTPLLFGTGLGGLFGGRGAAGQRSELTSAGPQRPGTVGVEEPGPAGQVARVPVTPGMYSGVLGRTDDRSAERETWLIGDEDWTDGGPSDGAIGRPPAATARDAPR